MLVFCSHTMSGLSLGGAKEGMGIIGGQTWLPTIDQEIVFSHVNRSTIVN